MSGIYKGQDWCWQEERDDFYFKNVLKYKVPREKPGY